MDKNQHEITQSEPPSKQVKIACYHSLGLLKIGAAHCFSKTPYLSR